MPIITLTTDFGLQDAYVGAMKGVILSISPEVTIVDISHGIPPQAITQGAFVLAAAVPYFPEGTVHVVVVDPGVGSQRRPIAVQTPRAIFVAPDNGVLTPILRSNTSEGTPVTVVHLTRREYWLPQVSYTFHGRDIFAPVAAYLARGVPITSLGEPIDDPVILDLPQPRRMPDGSLQGQVVYVDQFGNLVTNIPAKWLDRAVQWQIEVAGQTVEGLSRTYSDVPGGHLLALIGSTGALELAVREGNAARTLGIGVGEPVRVRPASP
ncbi:MAG: SAM-dependent chlorinase/fluorinase [Anaerolineae bacterium]|nr:SAM-dependent chlorinase/fluorinase [Anaerolineae bacterium]MDW8098126.1 SAM-dependent chlorinase/fluorinase [Anaerolineae bacterium]